MMGTGAVILGLTNSPLVKTNALDPAVEFAENGIESAYNVGHKLVHNVVTS